MRCSVSWVGLQFRYAPLSALAGAMRPRPGRRARIDFRHAHRLTSEVRRGRGSRFPGSAMHQAPMRQPLEDLLPLGKLPAGARVLDLGCGSGTVSYSGFPALRFFGIDQFAHTHTSFWPENASLALARAESLPWADSAFDAALCNFVFEHLSDPRAALRELERVVVPGGLLYVSIPRSDSLQDRLYRFTTKGGGHLQRYSFHSFVGLVYQETGFKLEGMAAAPGGFTWLNEVPCGSLIRGLLYRAFRSWHRATGNNPLAASDFLLLFRSTRELGFKQIGQVCSLCGKSISKSPAGANGSWRCPVCAFDNLLVSH